MSMMEQFANPDTMHSLSFGEKMAGTGITALMGMGITFAILIILWVMIAIMGKIMRGSANRAKRREELSAAAEAAAAPAAAPAAAAAGAAPAAAASDDALIAVLTAAIAAAEGDGAAAPTSNLIIKKIQRVAGPATAWNTAGIGESLDSRRMY